MPSVTSSTAITPAAMPSSIMATPAMVTVPLMSVTMRIGIGTGEST